MSIGGYRVMNRTVLFALYLGLACSPAAEAADFTVNSTTDSVDTVPGDGFCMTAAGDCTLRAAVQETNALFGPDRILLPPGLFVLQIGGPGEDVGATGDLDVFDAVEIQGSGATRTVIDGGGGDRVFHILGAAVINGVAIQNGRADVGGGVLIGPFRALTLIECVVWFNTAEGSGGGIHDSGRLDIVRSVIFGNRSGASGGGLTGGGRNVSTITDSWIVNNQAAFGGGIAFSGVAEIVVERSSIAGNRATESGGGIYSLRVTTEFEHGFEQSDRRLRRGHHPDFWLL